MRRALAACLLLWTAAGRAYGSPIREDALAVRTVPRYSLVVAAEADSLVADGADSLRAEARPSASAGWTREALTQLASRIRDRLLARGEIEATVRLSITESAGNGDGVARITIVRPAGATRAIAVVSGGSDVVPDAAGVFERASGGHCDPRSIAAGLTALRAEAQARGRYGAEASIDSIVSRADPARVHVGLHPGPEVAVDTLDLPGATTKFSVAASISGLTKGRTLTPAALDEARARLLESDLFVSVGPLSVQPSSPGRARVVAPVVENRSSRFEGAVGLQSDGSPTGLIDLALGNIGGSGRDAGARWAGYGGGRSDYAANYREPTLFGSGVDAAVALEAQMMDSLYTQTRWSLAADARLASRARAGATVRHSGSVYTGAAQGSSGTLSVEGRFQLDRLEPRWNPVRGFDFRLGVEAGRRSESAPGIERWSRRLFRGSLFCEAARPTGASRALYASLRAERVSLGEGPFPVEELRYVGGSEGLRGHADRAYAGDRIVAMSLEHRWISRTPGARSYLFLDAARHSLDGPVQAGSAGSTASSSSLARTQLSPGWEFGYGAGLRSPLAAGTVGIELGFAPGASVREGMLHLHFATNW
jgi:hypothetical protein